jgi:hypothetical protein
MIATLVCQLHSNSSTHLYPAAANPLSTIASATCFISVSLMLHLKKFQLHRQLDNSCANQHLWHMKTYFKAITQNL